MGGLYVEARMTPLPELYLVSLVLLNVRTFQGVFNIYMWLEPLAP